MKKVLIVVLVLVLLGAGGAYYYFNFMAPAEEEEQTEKVITKTIALGAKQPEGVPVPITTVSQVETKPGAPAATAPSAAPVAAPAATAPATAATAKPQVAATTAVKPQPAAAAVTFKPWVVNVASLPKKQDAENLAKKLGDGGFNVYQMSADVKGTKWYRVRVGFYDSKADAEAASKKLKAKDKSIDDPWIVKIDKAEFDKYVK